MTEGHPSDAPVAPRLPWNSIDWERVDAEVRRLQVRIAKAVKEGKNRKAKALQWLLTHSYYGKLSAVKRVTSNDGKNTPGIDGVTWTSSSHKIQGVLSLKRRGYSPQPLRRVHIPKKDGCKRPLSIPTMKDRAMQALHLLALTPVAETTAAPHSYGFREERCCADALEQAHRLLARRVSPKWILEGDIKACFDKISHDWLLENVLTDTKILQEWLKAGFVWEGSTFPTHSGTPQGGIISPCLAVMTLSEIESVLKEQFKKRFGESHKKVNVIFYADDFIVTGSSKELLENEVRPLVEELLARRGLTLHPQKTVVTHIDDGFVFLGHNVRKYKEKLLITPAKRNVKDFLGKIRSITRKAHNASARELILKLNPMIRGWAMYFRHHVASDTFSYVDHCIWECLWRWTRRKHEGRTAQWVYQRYFKTNGLRDWCFRSEGAELIRMSSIPIRRFVQVKAHTNPYDPECHDYFENRKKPGAKLRLP